MPPLHGDWVPNWHDAATKARQEIKRSSPEPFDDPYSQEIGNSPRSIARDHAFAIAEEIADPRQGRAFLDIALGEITPIRETADRWLRDIKGTVREQTARQHERSLALLAEYLAEQSGEDAKTILVGTGMEAVNKRVAGAFVEWLQQTKKLHPKTVGSRVSALSSFWKWSERKGETDGNPWAGQTHGLKRKAEAAETEETDERPYTEDELVRLLCADPNEGRGPRWSFGAALFDLTRLALLTGARQNELASLTRKDIMEDCQGIVIARQRAKTASGARRIPLHPIAQDLLRARLAGLPPTADPAAPVFPECPPGGPDGKRSWHFSKKFTDFRRTVLGDSEALDFHSLRRSFSTYLARARTQGVSEASADIQADLMGHKRGTLAGTTYTERQMPWETLVAAINGTVEKGFPPRVLKALQETAAARPALPASVAHPKPVRASLQPRRSSKGVV